LDLKTFIMLAVIQILLLSFQGILYLGVQNFQGAFHDMARPLDRKIPLVSQAVFIYIIWYPLIALYPIYLYSLNSMDYYIYILAIVLDIIVSTLIYLCYPTSFQRPKPPTGTFSGKILSLLYTADYKGLNCMPSMHCSMCFIIILSVWSCSQMETGVQSGFTILACGILGSTLLTKQHVVVDMLAALPLGIICFLVSHSILC